LNDDFANVLSEQHLCLFGQIVQCFAHYELTIARVLSNVGGTDLQAVLTLTQGTGFDDKRRALLDLFRHREIPLDRFDRVFACLQVPHTYLPLLSAIEHSLWRKGAAEDSIQPDWLFAARRTVEPACADAGEPVGRFTALSATPMQYTLKELRGIANELMDSHRFFVTSLKEMDLLRPS